MPYAHNPENIGNLDLGGKFFYQRTPNGIEKRGSAAGGAHFCCTDQQPIFSCDVAVLHGDAFYFRLVFPFPRHLVGLSNGRTYFAVRFLGAPTIHFKDKIAFNTSSTIKRRCG